MGDAAVLNGPHSFVAGGQIINGVEIWNLVKSRLL
jgi:hypothetical protein